MAGPAATAHAAGPGACLMSTPARPPLASRAAGLAARLALAAALLAGVPGPARGGDPASETCATRVAEARFDLKDAREREQLAPVRRDADQAVFDLLEPLWQAGTTERLRYLAGKHARDRSRVLVDREAIARERAEAKLAVLEGECFERGRDASADRARYEELACDLVRKQAEVASVDRDYWEEVIESLEELRAQELITEQRLILARFELASAKIEERARHERARGCRAALAAVAAAGERKAADADPAGSGPDPRAVVGAGGG